MQKIIVLNSKGGCGKTTIATNIASYYAQQGMATALMDYDPQGSSMRWLSLRPKEKEPIFGVQASRQPGSTQTRAFQLRLPPETERVVLDAPAGISGQELIDFICQVNILLIPVLPSPIDIHAATGFIKDLLLVGKIRNHGVRVAVLANRVRENTLVYQSLKKFLATLKLPLIASLRDTQHYVQAAQRGIGVHELWVKRAEQEHLQWQHIMAWLEDSRAELIATQRHVP